MSADALIAEAKQLIAKAETGVKKIENDAEPTQLRIAVNRLRLFLEQHGIDAPKSKAPKSDPAPEVAEKSEAKVDAEETPESDADEKAETDA